MRNILNYKKRIIVLLFLFILIVFLLLILCKKINKEVKIDNTLTKVTTSKKENKKSKPTGSSSYIDIYNYEDLIVAINKDLENNLDLELYKLVGKYKCDNIDCKSYGYYINENYIVIKDDKYYLYNYKEDERIKLDLPSAIYNDIKILAYEDDIKGLSISNINDLYSFYSFKENDFITDFKYTYIKENDNLLYNQNKFIGIILENEIELNYVFDMKKKKEVFKSDVPLRVVGNEETIYYLKDYSIDNMSISFFNDEFENIFNGEKFELYSLTDEGNIILKEENVFSLYNKEGKLIKKSKKYIDVLDFYGEYILVVDNDNYLKLVNSDGSIMAKYILMDDKYAFVKSLSYKKDDTINIIIKDINSDNLELKSGLLCTFSIKNRKQDILIKEDIYN